MKRLVAFSCGRRNGNTEIFVKEALAAAEKKGVEVRLIRLADWNLHNCSACSQGLCPSGFDITKCIYKDDAPELVEEFLNSDGVILGAPTYAYTPGSLFFALRDRVFGPKLDFSLTHAGMPEPNFVKGRGFARPGGLISVGGAGSEHWTSLNLPSLYSATFSPQVDVVDHMNVMRVADMTAASVCEEGLRRAREIGEHVAEAMLTGDHSWRGEDSGTCPVCHLNHITLVPGTNKVTCPVCGITGYLSMKDGVPVVDWPDTPECREENRNALSGKLYHAREVMEIRKTIFEPHEVEAKEKAKDYREYDRFFVTPPSKRKDG